MVSLSDPVKAGFVASLARPGGNVTGLCDLPVEEARRIYLVLNRKTAKALGLTLPQELLQRVDRVIE
jgi:putative ABC transport system substrate-binding protein